MMWAGDTQVPEVLPDDDEREVRGADLAGRGQQDGDGRHLLDSYPHVEHAQRRVPVDLQLVRSLICLLISCRHIAYCIVGHVERYKPRT